MDTPRDAGLITDATAARRGPLRIACVTETWPPEVNGVSLTVARMVEGLRARGHSVQLLRPRQHRDPAPQADARPHEVLLRGLPIPRYPHLRMGMPSRRALVRLWTQQRPDVVHLATEGPLGWSALRAALQLRLPVCSDFRTNFHAYTQHYGIGWLRQPILGYLRGFHNRTRCTMVPTQALQQTLAAEGFERLEVVARGVDTRQFSPARRSATLRAQWGAGEGTLVVACVGRIAREKNLELLQATFGAIASRVPGARLLVVGTGPLEGELRAACPGAVFAGQRHGEDLAAHYASADLLLFPSLTETFGNITTEAMASGLPLVAFDYAAAAQMIVRARQGLRVPFGNAAAFVEAAVALAADPARRAWMGDAARQRALLFGWDTVIGRFEAVLRGAAHAGRA